MDSQIAIGLATVAIAALAGVSSTIIGIWKNGKSAGRSEAAAERVEKAVALIQEHAIKIAEHSKDIEHLKDHASNTSNKLSDFAQVLGRTREEMISQHSLGE